MTITNRVEFKKADKSKQLFIGLDVHARTWSVSIRFSGKELETLYNKFRSCRIIKSFEK